MFFIFQRNRKDQQERADRPFYKISVILANVHSQHIYKNENVCNKKNL